MKRKWLPKLVTVTVMMFLLVGCGDAVDGTKGSIQSESEGIQNDEGTPAAKDLEEHHIIFVSEKESGKRNLLYRVLFHHPDDMDPEDDEVIYEYEYDEAERLLRESDYAYGLCMEYEYNISGKLMKCTRFSKGDLNYWSEYEYDVSGYLVREKNFCSDGSIGSYTEYENDSAGNVLKKVSYGVDGSMINSVEYTYDMSGNLTEETRYEENAHGNYETRIEYTYDASGNLLRETGFTNGRFFRYNEYVYDTDENLTRKEVHFISSFNGEDTLDNYLQYTYDESGTLLTTVMYDRDGNVFYDTVGEKFVECYRYEYRGI